MSITAIVGKLQVAVEDRLLTAPKIFYRPLWHAPDDASRMLRELQETGAVSLGRVFDLDEVLEVRAAIDDAVNGRRPDIHADWGSKVLYTKLLNPLLLHPRLLSLATHPLAGALAERYFRRRAYLADVDLRRIPPADMAQLAALNKEGLAGYSSSNWHRDIRGRQVKMMVYLTHVGPGDTNFAFLPGTHSGKHYRSRPLAESRVSDEIVERMGITPHEWCGEAGTAMLFDTNLIHRLRRRAGARMRDSVTFYYTPGQTLRHIEVRQTQVKGLSPLAQALFEGRREKLAGAV